MKYRDPVTGNLLDIFLPAGGDTLPIGTIVNYDGEDVPMNYELVEGGEILNEASTSMNDSYSCNYINGTVLYDNSTGSNENISLNDSAVNYNKLEIVFKDNDGFFNSTFVNNPNGKKINLNTVTTYSNAGYIKGRLILISGTSISNVGDSYSQIRFSGTSLTITNVNHIYITKVIGYK